MDKKTFAQFLIFSAVVLMAWWVASYMLFGPSATRRTRMPAPVAQQPAPVRPAAGPQPAAVGPAGATSTSQRDVRPPATLAAAPQVPAVTAVLENGLIRTHWTSVGAAVSKLELLGERYRAPYAVEGERPVLALLQEFQEGLHSDTVEAVTFYSPGAEGAAVENEVGTALLGYDLVEQTAETLVFEGLVDAGGGRALRIRKTVTCPPDSYDYRVALEFQNAADGPLEFAFALRGAAGIERESLTTRYLGTRIGVHEAANDYDIVKAHPKDLTKKGPEVNQSTDIAWAGVVNHYFIAITLPEERDWVESVTSRSVTDGDLLNARGRWGRGVVRRDADRPFLARQNATVALRSTRASLQAGESLVRRYALIAAPKEDRVLRAYDAGLPRLVEYGLLPMVSRLALAVLNGVYAVIPNYGIAILMLTGFIRVLLHPLTRKSQLSFSKMQRLQPQLVELQKKHAGDKQKLTQEQFALYQRYGISPLGGCWPMLLQMPVLISLFGALRAAIELRHAGFLWMADLSQPDTLFHLPFYLPLLGNQFNLLPILMAVVMFLNQRFTPKPGTDQAKQQQAMMKFFPIFLAVMFYQMPSGLCLYFTTSTAIGTLERWIIERKAANMELKPVAEAGRRKERRPAPAQKAAKKGWLAKLGQVQKSLLKQQQTGRQAKGKKRGR